MLVGLASQRLFQIGMAVEDKFLKGGRSHEWKHR